MLPTTTHEILLEAQGLCCRDRDFYYSGHRSWQEAQELLFYSDNILSYVTVVTVFFFPLHWE